MLRRFVLPVLRMPPVRLLKLLLFDTVMGRPMAIRLLQAGLPVVAWNRTRAKAETLVAHGAKIADHPEEAVRNADIVITMLEAGATVAEVLGKALPGLQHGSLVIDMSSTRQSEAQKSDSRLRHRLAHDSLLLLIDFNA